MKTKTPPQVIKNTSNCNCRILLQIVLFFVSILHSVFVQHDKGGLSTLLTTHASLNDLEACSESSKSGLYKTSTFVWFASMFRIIQKWIVQNIQFWMTSLSSKIGSYKTSNFGRCIIILKWIIQNFHLWRTHKHAQNHSKVDCKKHPNLDDISHYWQITHIRMICVDHKSSESDPTCTSMVQRYATSKWRSWSILVINHHTQLPIETPQLDSMSVKFSTLQKFRTPVLGQMLKEKLSSSLFWFIRNVWEPN